MDKVKILQFPFRDSNSGVANNSLGNLRRLDKEKFICHFGTVGVDNLPLEKKVTEAGAQLKYISCYGEKEPERFVDEVTKLFKTERYDIVQLHTSFWKSFLVEEIAMNCGIPKVIVHSRSTMVDIKDEVARLEAERIHHIRRAEFSTALATDFWACSWPAADWLFGPQIPRERIRVMKNAIEAGKFVFHQETREKYRRELGLENCFVVGHVGRLCYQKNQEFLIDVFARLYAGQKNARLMLVGDGALKEQFQKKAEELGVAESVLFLGARADVASLLQAMDVFCLPSRFEGFGNVLVEAQSAGLKCLASDFLPRETEITENIRYLSLSVDRWADELLEVAKGYQRRNMINEITAAGYNIEQQIKVIEAAYLA